MKSTDSRILTAVSYLLIFGVAGLRVELINPYNIVPVFACLLFFAAVRPSNEIVVPLSLFVGVDIFITKRLYGYAVTADSAVTWAWYLFALLLGSSALKSRRSWQWVAGCSLLASVSFFIVSNFSVWTFWNMYPKSLAGLGTCYVAALPFFRNSLTSELCASLLLFGIPARFPVPAVSRIALNAHS